LKGNPLLDARTPQTQSVVTPQLAYLVHHVLRDETARWPSLGYPNALEIGRPAGAKIGRVEGNRQVWAAGYTRQNVAIFSLSLPDDSQIKLAPRMVAGLWHAMMQYASRDQPAVDWTEPPGITHLEVCDPSGQLPTEACPKTASEVFLNGAEPNSPDTLYRTFQINAETGRLATVFTPSLYVEEKTFLVVPPQARAWAQAAQLPLPPQEYDAIQPPGPSPNVQITAPDSFAFVHGQVTLQGTASGDGFKLFQVQVGQGVNPQTWLQVGPDGTSALVNGDFGVWDTQGLEGLYSIRLQVVRADQTVEMAVIQVTVDNTAPLVRIPYPINRQEFERSQSRVITFQAEVDDAIGVQRIVWLVDGATVGDTSQPPYVFAWQVTPGEHVLEVKAYDQAGNEGKSEQVHFTVK
jgi:membrane carboxypeptidase/penicillin-binding protein PbpC